MRYDLSSDNKIVKAILFGVKERNYALERLYMDEACKIKVLRFIKSNKGNDADGKDFFHEGLIVLDRNIRILKFRGECS